MDDVICKHCGCLMMDHSRDLLAEQCYPAQIGRLRTAHDAIIRKYERIMGDPPEGLNFKPDDSRLKFAREAWFGAAQISRKAIE